MKETLKDLDIAPKYIWDRFIGGKKYFIMEYIENSIEDYID
jgi:hypothetical protein